MNVDKECITHHNACDCYECSRKDSYITNMAKKLDFAEQKGKELEKENQRLETTLKVLCVDQRLQVKALEQKIEKLEAVRRAAQNYVDTFACRLTLTSSITVPEKIDGKFTGDVKVKKLSETDFDGLSELKQALEEAK